MSKGNGVLVQKSLFHRQTETKLKPVYHLQFRWGGGVLMTCKIAVFFLTILEIQVEDVTSMDICSIAALLNDYKTIYS